MHRFAYPVYAVLFLAASLSGCGGRTTESAAPATLKIGHVGHDHHLALFVALDHAGEYAEETGLSVKTIRDRALYELYDRDKKVANLEIVQVGGGSKMPTALAQGLIDIGLGGIAPVLAACDRGAPVQLIAPLHSRGDMLVVGPESPITSWQDFAAMIRESDIPIRIGYKSPMAVAKLLLEDALAHEGLSFSGDPTRTSLEVHLINLKGGGHLNTALSEGLVDAYVGNNPYPAIGEETGIGKVVCDLEELPPGRFRNHPCCCVAANTESLAGKEDAVVGLLVLLLEATETINSDLDTGVESACRWIGTSEAVERASIPTSGYLLQADVAWRECMTVWFQAMNDLGTFHGMLKDLSEEDAAVVAYELSFLKRAEGRLDFGQRDE